MTVRYGYEYPLDRAQHYAAAHCRVCGYPNLLSPQGGEFICGYCLEEPWLESRRRPWARDDEEQ